jgi:hypothetical protein
MNKNTQNNTELLNAVISQASLIRNVSVEVVADVPELMAEIRYLCEFDTAEISVADLIAEIALRKFDAKMAQEQLAKQARIAKVRQEWTDRLNTTKKLF